MNRWLQSRLPALPLVSGLGMASIVSTAAPSRQFHTPPSFSTLCYQKKIASGSFGAVELLVDLTTGYTAARKRFFKLRTVTAQKDAITEWERAMASVWNEVRIMQENPHVRGSVRGDRSEIYVP